MPVERGLPIGNLTSQWWANLYLDGLDHHAKRSLKVPSYQRYMDDFTLFGDDREALLSAREAIRTWLTRERRLKLKDPDAPALRTNRLHPYLGYRISPRGIQPGVRMRGRIPELLTAHRDSPESMQAAVASIRSAWMFS